MFSLLYITVNLNLLFFLHISNLHEDMCLCMMENVLSSVVLIAAIFRIILACSQYQKTFKYFKQKGQGVFKLFYFKLLKFVVCDFFWDRSIYLSD